MQSDVFVLEKTSGKYSSRPDPSCITKKSEPIQFLKSQNQKQRDASVTKGETILEILGPIFLFRAKIGTQTGMPRDEPNNLSSLAKPGSRK